MVVAVLISESVEKDFVLVNFMGWDIQRASTFTEILREPFTEIGVLQARYILHMYIHNNEMIVY